MASIANSKTTQLTERRPLLVLQSAATFSDDLGGFGEYVPPRVGKHHDTKADQEDYVLRRLLVALKRAHDLHYPVYVWRGRAELKEPDFVLQFVDDSPIIGVEVRQVTSPEWQVALSLDAEKAARNDQRIMEGRFEDLEVVPLRGRFGDQGRGPTEQREESGFSAQQANDRFLNELASAIVDKEAKRAGGQYSTTVDVWLLLYDNSQTGHRADVQQVLPTLRQRQIAAAFSRIHLVMDATVWLDIMSWQRVRKMDISRDYDIDLYEWADEQASLARKVAVAELDYANIAEELELLGKSQRQSRDSYLRILLLHLLKWRYQPQKRTRSWENSIMNSRRSIEQVIETSPSLNLLTASGETRDADLAKVYQRARRDAARETRLPVETFPEDCPFTVDDILDLDFLPGEQGGSECG